MASVITKAALFEHTTTSGSWAMIFLTLETSREVREGMGEQGHEMRLTRELGLACGLFTGRDGCGIVWHFDSRDEEEDEIDEIEMVRSRRGEKCMSPEGLIRRFKSPESLSGVSYSQERGGL